MLLQESILTAVAAVGVGVRQVLWTIQFDGQICVCIEQVNLHLPAVIKRDGQKQMETPQLDRLAGAGIRSKQFAERGAATRGFVPCIRDGEAKEECGGHGALAAYCQ